MHSVSCSACRCEGPPNPPNCGYWALVVSFWIFSLLFGIGAALGADWGLLLLVAWLLLATTMGVLVRRATVWTCSECGATVTGPGLRSASPVVRQSAHSATQL